MNSTWQKILVPLIKNIMYCFGRSNNNNNNIRPNVTTCEEFGSSGRVCVSKMLNRGIISDFSHFVHSMQYICT